jgi:phage gp36-like protein
MGNSFNTTPATAGSYIYAQLADIRKHTDKRLLVQLTNDDDLVDPTDTNQIDETILAIAENEGAATINNYLRNVYDDLPLTGSNLTPDIVLIAAKLALCNLWRRRGDEPQQVTDMRRELMARLKQMGSPAPDENLNKAKSPNMMPVRLVRGKTRTIYDDSGMFDGLPSQGRTTLPADTEPGNS